MQVMRNFQAAWFVIAFVLHHEHKALTKESRGTLTAAASAAAATDVGSENLKPACFLQVPP